MRTAINPITYKMYSLYIYWNSFYCWPKKSEDVEDYIINKYGIIISGIGKTLYHVKIGKNEAKDKTYGRST